MSLARVKPATFTGKSKDEQLASLQRKVAACQTCPGIVEARTQTVFGEGNPDAALMFVGEAPGVNEDEVGRPFIGAAGTLLTRVIRALGVDRGDVYIANVLKCRPNPSHGQANRAPTRPEMVDCAPFLFAQIKIIEPVAIVALGATAAEALGIEDKITAARGRWYRYEHIPLTATFHPAYVLRNPTLQVRSQFWLDIKEAWESCGLSAKEDADWIPEIGA